LAEIKIKSITPTFTHLVGGGLPLAALQHFGLVQQKDLCVDVFYGW
jgi:hypothetical protein